MNLQLLGYVCSEGEEEWEGRIDGEIQEIYRQTKRMGSRKKEGDKSESGGRRSSGNEH
jgi:hypothetical protein